MIKNRQFAGLSGPVIYEHLLLSEYAPNASACSKMMSVSGRS